MEGAARKVLRANEKMSKFKEDRKRKGNGSLENLTPSSTDRKSFRSVYKEGEEKVITDSNDICSDNEKD